MKNFLSIAIFSLCAFQSIAQQESMYTHYPFNTQMVNPAYAGNRGVFSATLVHRSQWVGFDGAPMSQSLVLSTPLLNDVLGIGANFQNDKIGPTNIFTGNIDIAAKVKINRHSKISFGMNFGLRNYGRNLTGLNAYESGDFAIVNNTSTQMIFDLGAGILYTNKRFYVGVSMPRILNNHFPNANSSITLGAKEKQHYFVTAGTAFNISKSVECKPSTFVKIVEGTMPQFDLTSMFVFNKKFELGAMWRSSDAAGLLLGYTFNRNFRVGYSFDWSYGLRTFKNNYGSHELMLRYDLHCKKGGKDIISPRYF
ncbi:MAG: type IX secretion system membrane protein PorP/SprF [Bacteroidota bacterium]